MQMVVTQVFFPGTPSVEANLATLDCRAKEALPEPLLSQASSTKKLPCRRITEATNAPPRTARFPDPGFTTGTNDRLRSRDPTTLGRCGWEVVLHFASPANRAGRPPE